MTSAEVGELLKKTGLPVAYESFPEGEVPELPFICYINPETNGFAADGKVYYESLVIFIELYTEKRDTVLEKCVEKVLEDFYFEKEINHIKDEKCYQITYELEV